MIEKQLCDAPAGLFDGTKGNREKKEGRTLVQSVKA